MAMSLEGERLGVENRTKHDEDVITEGVQQKRRGSYDRHP